MGLGPVDGHAGWRHQAQCRVKPLERLARVVKVRIAVVEGAAVVGAHDEKAHRLGVVLLQHIADGEEVAKRLAHLLVVHAHETVVHPKARQRLARGAFALGDFVFMVRKLQVSTATVDVKSFAQRGAAHGRAFDVPARAARAKGAVPLGFGRLALFGGFPQHKVERIFLAVLHRNAFTGAQLIQRFTRELAVARKLAHRVVHVAMGRAIGQALAFELADQRQHLRHVFGGARLKGGGLDAQGANVGVHGSDHFVGELADGDAPLQRPLDDLVINVGDVAHIGHAVAAAFEPALHHVKRHHHAGVANVAQVIDGHAAHIHAHMTRFERGKIFQGTRQRVVDAQTHGISVTRDLMGGRVKPAHPAAKGLGPARGCAQPWAPSEITSGNSAPS